MKRENSIPPVPLMKKTRSTPDAQDRALYDLQLLETTLFCFFSLLLARANIPTYQKRVSGAFY